MNITDFNKSDLVELIKKNVTGPTNEIADAALLKKQQYYSNKIYARGLIEFTNVCKNNCYYCGIRCDNKNIKRYRLTKDEILSCCDTGIILGFSTFVLQ